MSFKIALVGEAYGASEDILRRPFVGAAGAELDRLLADAGIQREECFVTNVFNLRPEGNKIESLCCGKREGLALPGYSAIVAGKYIRSEYGGELTRLYSELAEVQPNITVALGNVASWALLDSGRISKIRGACNISTRVPGLKILPTYHPAAVLRQYDLRHITVLDLQKARRESEFPELRRPDREIWLDPDLDDLERFFQEFVRGSRRLAFDIETLAGTITCIGFAPSVDRAIVIPFFDPRKPGNNYWSTLEDEARAWGYVERYLATPSEKVAQNGLYDIQYLWQKMGIPVVNFAHDTMLLHHSLLPEAPKGLAVLGSIYTNEVAWKNDRPRGKHDDIKREDTA